MIKIYLLSLMLSLRIMYSPVKDKESQLILNSLHTKKSGNFLLQCKNKDLLNIKKQKKIHLHKSPKLLEQIRNSKNLNQLYSKLIKKKILKKLKKAIINGLKSILQNSLNLRIISNLLLQKSILYIIYIDTYLDIYT